MKCLFILFLFSFNLAEAQMNTDNKLPYDQIPDYYEDFTSGNVIARLIDGLGYRYHWASKDLRQEEIDFMPSDDGQSMISTIEHILALSTSILNCSASRPNIRPTQQVDMEYSDMRKLTLQNLWAASQRFKGMSPSELEKCKVIFQRGAKVSEFPFWNMINGQISDALYHTGQVVSFRRTTGNPIDPNVNVFTGKNRN